MLGFSSLSNAPLAVAVPVTLITVTLDGASATSTAGAVSYANDTTTSVTGLGSTSGVGTLAPKTVADVSLDDVPVTASLGAARFGIADTFNATGVNATGSTSDFSAVKGAAGDGFDGIGVEAFGLINDLDLAVNNGITIPEATATVILGLNGVVRAEANTDLVATPATASLGSITTEADAVEAIVDLVDGLRAGFNGNLVVTGKANATLTSLSTTASLNTFTREVEIAVTLETLLGPARLGPLTATGVVFDFSAFAENYSKSRTVTILPWQSSGATSNTVFIQQENFTVTIEPYYTAYPKTVFILN